MLGGTNIQGKYAENQFAKLRIEEVEFLCLNLVVAVVMQSEKVNLDKADKQG
jgi:hypothetical protein